MVLGVPILHFRVVLDKNISCDCSIDGPNQWVTVYVFIEK